MFSVVFADVVSLVIGIVICLKGFVVVKFYEFSSKGSGAKKIRM